MKIKILPFLLIIFCSCYRTSTSEKDNSGSVLKIDLLSEPESRVNKLSEFATDVEYIPLQTIENSLMGGFVGKIVNIDKRIYILNKILNGDEILCFNINGKFLFKIETIGRGPEEYSFIDDFDVSSDNKILTILSSLDNKLLVYAILENGFNFQKSITLKKPVPDRISMVPETYNTFMAVPPYRGIEPTLSLLIDTDGDTIHFKPNCYKYKMVRKNNYRADNETIVYPIEDKVCFKEEFSDTVFYIDANNKSFKPRMILNSNGKLTTPEIRGGSEASENHTIFIANIFETSRYVFYYYGTMETRNKILFDKKTDIKYKLDNESGIDDDLSGGPDFNIEFVRKYCSGSSIFSFIEAMTLKKYVAGEDFINAKIKDPKKKEELQKLANSLKETDNPVLVMVRLKK